MKAVSSLAPALVGVGAVIFSYLYCGQDMDTTESFLMSNLGNMLLAVQIVVIFIMAMTKNYTSGAILIVTTILTALIQGAIL